MTVLCSPEHIEFKLTTFVSTVCRSSKLQFYSVGSVALVLFLGPSFSSSLSVVKAGEPAVGTFSCARSAGGATYGSSSRDLPFGKCRPMLKTLDN